MMQQFHNFRFQTKNKKKRNKWFKFCNFTFCLWYDKVVLQKRKEANLLTLQTDDKKWPYFLKLDTS